MAFLAVAPIQVLDLAGPFEVFSRVSRFDLAPGYRLTLTGISDVEATCGLAVRPSKHFRKIRTGIDTLIVVGGEGVEEHRYDNDLIRWVRMHGRRSRRVASVCTGAFLPAEAGLLDGRRAVTHWAYCQTLARQYQRVNVDPHPIYVKDGHIYTSAGITAGIDLALALSKKTMDRRLRFGSRRTWCCTCGDPAIRRSSASSWTFRRPAGRPWRA